MGLPSEVQEGEPSRYSGDARECRPGLANLPAGLWARQAIHTKHSPIQAATGQAVKLACVGAHVGDTVTPPGISGPSPDPEIIPIISTCKVVIP